MILTTVQTSHNRAVATWLLVCCGLVFIMVVLGGVTRLTGSGLSMSDWRPVTGFLPPMSEQAWQQEFDQYRATPEFQQINSYMDVDDFKGIFWLEYLHRLLGRIIGLAFLLPFLYFLYRQTIQKSEIPKYLLMFVLGGMQGVLGWYMVKSGLVDDPHVSQYRLTAHLVAAILIYAYMFWVAMGLLYRATDGPRHPWYRRSFWLTALITLTIISGGFVAGLKAGLAYNTFPLMAGKWIPSGMFVFEPAWRNFFDNLVTVQFDHRWLAITTLVLISIFWAFGRKAGFPDRLKPALNALLMVTVLQVILGISTLLLKVPIPLGAAHQGVAMLLFTVALYLVHGLRGVKAP